MYKPGDSVRINPEAVRVLKDGTFKLTVVLDVDEATVFKVVGQIHDDVMIAQPPFPSRVVIVVSLPDVVRV